MLHLDHDQLVLLALGDEPLVESDAAHLRACPTCASEYAALREVAGLGAQTEDLRDLPEPPARVWEAISAQAFGGTALRTHLPDRTVASYDADPFQPAHRRAGDHGPHNAAPERPALDLPVDGQPPRRDATAPARTGSQFLRLMLVAVLGIAIGVAGAVGVQALRQDNTSTGPVVVATGEFTPKSPLATGAGGTVSIADTGHGRQLTIEVDGLPVPQGLYEAWLLDPTANQLIPLGAMSRTGGTFDVTDAPLATFTVVDISAQTLDGAQGHGISMLQAPLS